MVVTDIQNRIRAIDWLDLSQVADSSSSLLSQLAGDPEMLWELTTSVRENSELMALCEHYDILDKIVVYNDTEAGARLRLHIFLPGYFDRPHNHRWTYSSLILSGGYVHTLYGTEDRIHDGMDVSSLSAMLVRREEVGSAYTLHHTMVHSVVADPYTVSLILRGPSVKQRFLVMDRKTNQAWWQFGATDEAPEIALKKRMSPERLEQILTELSSAQVFNRFAASHRLPAGLVASADDSR
jgi:hypothetical protein